LLKLKFAGATGKKLKKPEKGHFLENEKQLQN